MSRRQLHVYCTEEFYEQVWRLPADVNISAVCRRALRAEMRRHGITADDAVGRRGPRPR